MFTRSIKVDHDVFVARLTRHHTSYESEAWLQERARHIVDEWFRHIIEISYPQETLT